MSEGGAARVERTWERDDAQGGQGHVDVGSGSGTQGSAQVAAAQGRAARRGEGPARPTLLWKSA